MHQLAVVIGTDPLAHIVANFSFLAERMEPNAMRNLIINKILCLQYRLGKVIGRKSAARICIIMDRGFTTFFGRERKDDKG